MTPFHPAIARSLQITTPFEILISQAARLISPEALFSIETFPHVMRISHSVVFFTRMLPHATKRSPPMIQLVSISPQAIYTLFDIFPQTLMLPPAKNPSPVISD
jgi:hypothetical protein